jgi:tetratricopeptide (TPR) repeat protein
MVLSDIKKFANKLAEAGDWGAKAMEANKIIIGKDKVYSIAYTRLAKCYKEIGLINEAIDTYNQVLLFDKDNIIANNRLKDLEYKSIVKGCNTSIENTKKKYKL